MCITIIVSCSEGSLGTTLAAYPITLLLCLVCSLFGVFVLGMLGLHTYLTIRNLTTAEYLKKYYKLKSGNPFEKYCHSHLEPSSSSTSSSSAGALGRAPSTPVRRCAAKPKS